MIKQVSKEIATPQFVTTAYKPGENDERYEQLKEAVRDLAAGQHDLHQRLEALVSVVAGIKDGNSTPAADQVSSESPAADPGTAFVPQRATRSWRAQTKRAAGFVLRHTLGTARRIWDAASPDPLWADQVVLRISGTAVNLPRLAVVQIVDEHIVDERSPDTDSVRQALSRQTDKDFACVVWHPENGACVHETSTGEVVRANYSTAKQLARALDIDYLWTLPSRVSDLPATFVETGRLLLGSEPLPFIRFERFQESAERALFWIIPELWRGDEGIDLEALDRLAQRLPERLLGKVVGHHGGYSLAPTQPVESWSRKIARRGGAYFVSARQAPRIFDHRLATLVECARSRPSEQTSVLFVIDTPLTGGVEETVATMADIFGDLGRLLVVNLAAPDDLSARRWRQLARLLPHVYSLPELFATEFFIDGLAYLIEAYKVRDLLYFSSEDAKTDQVAKLHQRFPAVHIVDHAADLPLELDLKPFDPALFTAARIADIRQHLAISNDTVLVTMVCDLIPSKRPEDFLALAHRCRDDERFVFLLVGEGSLLASLGDLNRCFGLRNLRLEPPSRPLAEILAASDIVCSTAESEPSPRTIVAALALGRPVVAPATGILPELLNDGPCGLVATEPGNLDDLEIAIRQLVTMSRRRELGAHGPKVAARVPGREALVETCRQVLSLPEVVGASAS